MHHVSVGVTENLHLNVARTSEVALEEDGRIAEGIQRLAPRSFNCL